MNKKNNLIFKDTGYTIYYNQYYNFEFSNNNYNTKAFLQKVPMC